MTSPSGYLSWVWVRTAFIANRIMATMVESVKPGGPVERNRTLKRVKKSSFKPLEPLASGGYSKVVSAKKVHKYWSLQKRDRKTYAVKICQVEHTEESTTCQDYESSSSRAGKANKFARLEKEFAILQEFRNSKHVVHTYDALFLDNNTSSEVWIVMEHLQVDLFDLMRYVQMNLAEISVLACGILSALEFVHSKGYVHKDIKLENILLSRTGLVKLCDFGLSEKLDHTGVGRVYSFKGTRYTMAPELFITGSTFTYTADVWSVGVLVSLMIDRKNQSIVFDDKHLLRAMWRYYKISNDVYFKKLIGFPALDFAAYPEHITKHLPKAWLSSVDGQAKMARCLRRSLEYRTAYDFVCRCLVPLPRTGPKGEITRKDTLERATIAELLEMDLILACKEKDLFKRQAVIGMVKRYRRASSKEST